MSIKIYSTLTRKKEEFKPMKDGEVGMYVCGPTVYDDPHIGHARSAYVFDVIRRYFTYKGYKVKFIRNVTDIDDKIINKARQEFKEEDLNIAVRNVSDKYLKVYHDYMEKLDIMQPDREPKATEYINKMVDFIQALILRGKAYHAGGDVYFDVHKANEYGKLSNQSFEMLESGASIAFGENKKDPLDFALWKSVKPDEPSWDSLWGKGRPGWHIECSVMSSDILGDEFDIHGGGIDLVFPHHENEIAQSEGAGKKFARYWIHNGLLTINKEKMAKSLGNFITIEDILNKYPADVFKICCLTVHYSNPLDFSWERMDVAKEEIERVRECINKIDYNIKQRKEYWIQSKPIKTQADFEKEINGLKSKFEEAMNDDFNTPQAKSVIFQIINRFYISNINLENINCLEYAKNTIIDLGKVLGLSFDRADEIDSKLIDMIEERNQARKAKDFKKSDSIRKELEEKGIILEDAKDGTVWRKRS